MSVSTLEIERVLSGAGFDVIVEENSEGLVVTGVVGSEAERQAVHDIVLSLAPDKQVIDNLEVLEVLPEHLQGMSLSEVEVGDFRGATPMTTDDEAIEAVDFMDQEVLTDPLHASGPTGVDADAEVGEGDEVYVPPTDPPVTREGEFLGGFQTTSMDDLSVERSSDDTIGDEALAEAVRRELAEDASTSDLAVDVEVRNGIVRVSGSVPTLSDAENVLAVAERIEGVVEVVDALDVTRL